MDRRRLTGRFLLTGSAHVLLAPKLTDSLAGRMEVLRLHPLSQAELAREPPRFLDRLFAGEFETRPIERLGRELAGRITAGGYPPGAGPFRGTAAGELASRLRGRPRPSATSGTWRAHPCIGRIAPAAGARCRRDRPALQPRRPGPSPFGLSRPTIRDYVTLLERVFLLERLPPWHSNRLSRLVKTPKLHFGDTGLACALLGATATALTADRTLLGPLLETFVFQELRATGGRA